MGPDAMIFVFWMLSFKPTFSLSSFTFIKRLFSSSFSAVRVVSSPYLKLLLFLPSILIPACASSSPEFHMMYSAHRLNKQGDNIQPWRAPLPVGNQLETFILQCSHLQRESMSDVQHSDSVTHTHASVLSQILSQCSLLRSTEYSSLGYVVGPS